MEMSKARFNYWKLAVPCAVLAMALIPSAGGSRASRVTDPASRSVANAKVDLNSEIATLGTYLDDLYKFDKECAQLNKKASLTAAEINPLDQKSHDLQGRLTGVQNAISNAIKKLRAANEWDDLDTRLQATLDPKTKTLFQGTSLKNLLEEAASQLSSHAKEVNTPLDLLYLKLAGQGLPPRGDVSTRSLRCFGAKIRIGLIHAFGAKPTNPTLDQTSCSCGAVNGIGTGTPCNALP
jgi:hypothetical protein